jgi:hypothetical protein
MPVAEQEETQQQEGSSGTRTALKAAAAAAATGAATLAVRKALSHDNDDGGDDDDGDSPRTKSKGGQNAGSIFSTAASSAWDSASEVVLPMAEDAVAAAGRYLAERAPEVVRDRLVPRFIEAFNEAN